MLVFVVTMKIQQDYVFSNDDDGHDNAGYQDKVDHEDDYGILEMIMLTLDTRAGWSWWWLCDNDGDHDDHGEDHGNAGY